MKFKDYEPIRFEIFQSDMEKIMYNLNIITTEIPDNILETKQEQAIRQLQLIKQDLQHKIDIHRERGEWK